MIKAMIEEVSIGQDLKPKTDKTIEYGATIEMVIPDWILDGVVSCVN
jgi:hypothetical protein